MQDKMRIAKPDSEQPACHRDTSPSGTDSTSTPATRAELPAVETRFAFVHEGLSGSAMIRGEPGVHMVGHFQVHALTQLTAYRPLQVLLHVSVSGPRPLPGPASAF